MGNTTYFGQGTITTGGGGGTPTVTTLPIPVGVLADLPTPTNANKGLSYFITDDKTGGPDGTFYISLGNKWTPQSGTMSADILKKTYEEIYGNQAGAPPRPRPGPKTTGYHGKTLSTIVNGDFQTTYDGQVIDGYNITGILGVYHKNVVVTNSRIQKYIRNNYSTTAANRGKANLVVIDCEIGPDAGIGATDGVGKAAVCYEGFTAIRCNIHGMGDAFKAGANSRVFGCWIHDLNAYPISQSDFEHCDGVQIQSDPVLPAKDIMIIGNHIVNSTFPNQGATSTVLCKADLGPIDGVRIERNWLAAPLASYAVYVVQGNYTADSIPHNVSVVGNYIAKAAVDYWSLTDKTITQENRIWDLVNDEVGDYLDPKLGTGNAIRVDGINTSSFVQTPHIAATPQSMYIEAEIRPDVVAKGGVQRIISQLNFSSNTQRTFSLFIDATGHLAFTWYTNLTGTSVTKTMTNVLPIANKERCKVGVWLELATPYKVHFYFAKYGDTLVEAEVLTGSTATVVVDGNEPITISGRSLNASERFGGEVYYATIKDGAAGSGGPLGTPFVNFDPTAVTVDNPISPTTFTATTGEVWTLGALARYVAPYKPTFNSLLADILKATRRTGSFYGDKTVDPTSYDGQDGDGWINNITKKYFKKSNGAWDSGTSIIGPTGNTGPQGGTTERRSLILPTGIITENVERGTLAFGSTNVLTTGKVYLTSVGLMQAEVIHGITFQSGSTAASGVSNLWFVLTDAAGVVLAVTADDAANGWAATTKKRLALASSYTVPSNGCYYLGVLVVATTVPSLLGMSVSNRVGAESPARHLLSGGTWSFVPTVGTTISASNNVNNGAYANCD